MTERFTAKQTAVLFTLMALGREVSNPQLQETVGFVLDGKDRHRLNDLKLVDSRKTGRSYSHELTDDGWKWCEEELSAGSPPPSRPRSLIAVAAYLVFRRLDEYRQDKDLQLAHLFPVRKEAPEATGSPEVAGSTESLAGINDLETAVGKAYRELARKPGGWVALVDLRRQLSAPKHEVDKALVELSAAGRIHLAPESNRKALTPEAKAAGVRLGNDDSHLIKIEEP